MSQLIKLRGKYSKGKYTIVDDIDFAYLRLYKWHETEDGYVARGDNGTKMHRHILNAERSVLVDHRNGDKLDNRRGNLRLADHRINATNRGRMKNNTSGCTGVYYDSRRNLWQAQLMTSGKKMHLGYFADRESAAAAYAQAATVHHGDSRRLQSSSEYSTVVM